VTSRKINLSKGLTTQENKPEAHENTKTGGKKTSTRPVGGGTKNGTSQHANLANIVRKSAKNKSPEGGKQTHGIENAQRGRFMTNAQILSGKENKRLPIRTPREEVLVGTGLSIRRIAKIQAEKRRRKLPQRKTSEAALRKKTQ